jgi:hypothetical protein
VIARIAGDRVLIDLRTVPEQDDAVVASVLEAAARAGTPAD